MATRSELRDLAQLRLREASALFDAALYDGCVYLCGYVVELALKARICAILDIEEYPETRLFKRHDFDELKLLAGLQRKITLEGNPKLFTNWSVATEWKVEWRYRRSGTCDRKYAEKILEAIESEPDGVLACIMSQP